MKNEKYYLHRILWQATQSFCKGRNLKENCTITEKRGGELAQWKKAKKSGKSELNFVNHPSAMLLCAATVSKQHSVGSLERIGFDQLVALCLWCSAADLSSCPESRIHFGFSKEMNNNNNPLRELDRGRDQRDHCGKKAELLHVFFCRPVFSCSCHLKFSAVHPNVREPQTWSCPVRVPVPSTWGMQCNLMINVPCRLHSLFYPTFIE